MKELSEVEILTPTKKHLLAQRDGRKLNPDNAYAHDTIASSAAVLNECGGQAVLAFRAVLGSYSISRPEMQHNGFALHPDFIRATRLPERQFRRAVSCLVANGFVEADRAPGRKPRIRLTDKGRMAIAGAKR